MGQRAINHAHNHRTQRSVKRTLNYILEDFVDEKDSEVLGVVGPQIQKRMNRIAVESLEASDVQFKLKRYADKSSIRTCFITTPTGTATGIALKVDEDGEERIVGETLAFTRAILAGLRRTDSLKIVNPGAKGIVDRARSIVPIGHKSLWRG